MTGSKRDRNKIVLLFLLALALLVYNVKKATNCEQAAGCINPYWSNFWLISYSDGYERRALVGQIMRTVFDNAVHYEVLNAVSLALVISIIVPVYYVFFSKVANNKYWPLIFLVLIPGPTSTVFFEVLGDPLHAAFACVVAYFFIARKLTCTVLHLVLAVIVGCIVTLVHEASIFLFAPAIYLICAWRLGSEPGFKVPGAIIVATMVAVVLIFNRQQPTSGGLALITRDSTPYFASEESLPSLVGLLKSELVSYLGSPKGPLRLVSRAATSFLWPMLMLLAISHVLKTKRPLMIFVYLLALSSPLYLIAHDWGRFAAYTFCLSLMMEGHASVETNVPRPRFVGYLLDKVVVSTGGWFGSVTAVCMLLLIFTSHPSYRIYGLSTHSVVLAFSALAAATLFNSSSVRP